MPNKDQAPTTASAARAVIQNASPCPICGAKRAGSMFGNTANGKPLNDSVSYRCGRALVVTPADIVSFTPCPAGLPN